MLPDALGKAGQIPSQKLWFSNFYIGVQVANEYMQSVPKCFHELSFLEILFLISYLKIVSLFIQ